MRSVLNKLVAVGLLGFAANAAASEVGSQERLAELKDQILEIAIANGDNRDNLVEVRAQLDPLVAELDAYQAEVQATEELDVLVGSWKEVWADDIEPQRPGFETDRDGVYQVITADGYFYNIGELDGPLGFTATGYLRGEYSDAGINLAIEFTDLGILFGGIDRVENLRDQIDAIESGEKNLIPTPGNPTFPNGPIGATGVIRNLYIDDEIRIATGSNDADGVQDLYVLTRVVGPVRYRN